MTKRCVAQALRCRSVALPKRCVAQVLVVQALRCPSVALPKCCVAQVLRSMLTQLPARGTFSLPIMDSNLILAAKLRYNGLGIVVYWSEYIHSIPPILVRNPLR